MGALAPRTIFSNDTGPLAGVGLDTLAQNQAAILELEGAQDPQSKTIASGSISPTAAYIIVDTEGGAAADDLDAINPVLSASENLHTGMLVNLKAADSGRVVTVKNSSSANGINTYDGNDYVLSTTHWLKLQLKADLKWYEVEGRAMEAAEAAATAADHATTKSGTSSTASGTAAKVATCSGFELSDQARVFVTFDNANTVADALTLNVNGTGAKSVYNQMGIISTSNTALFAANQPIEFRYDGTGWVFYDSAKVTAYFATSSTAAGTADKVATCAGFALSNPSRVFVTFSNANTVSNALTLNVNGTGAIAIYNQYGAVSSTNPALFQANQPIEFVYDGAHWVYHNFAAEAAHYAMSSNRSVSYSVTSGQSFTAPSDGAYHISYYGNPGYARIQNDTTGKVKGGTTTLNSSTTPCDEFLDVRKDDSIKVFFSGTVTLFKFYYNEGAR